MTRRWLLPFRFVFRHWLAFLLAVGFGFLAYNWQRPQPLWQIRFDGTVYWRGFTADDQHISVDKRIDHGSKLIFLNAATGEDELKPAPSNGIQDDMSHSGLGHVFSPGDDVFIYVAKRKDKWMLIGRRPSSGDVIAEIPLPSLEGVKPPTYELHRLVLNKTSSRLPLPAMSRDGKYLIYFTHPDGQKRTLHVWSIHDRREINQVNTEAFNIKVGLKRVLLENHVLDLTPKSALQPLPKVPEGNTQMEWIWDKEENSVNVLSHTSREDGSSPIVVRCFQLSPNQAEAKLLWESPFPGDQGVMIEYALSTPTYALLENRNNSFTIRSISTGKETPIRIDLREFNALNEVSILALGRGARQVNRVSRVGSLGNIATDNLVTKLLISKRELSLLGKFNNSLPTKLREYLAFAREKFYQVHVELLDLEDNCRTLASVPCPNEERSNVGIALTQKGDRFAILERNKQFSVLTCWSLPVHRTFLQYMIIVGNILVPFLFSALRVCWLRRKPLVNRSLRHDGGSS
ncbi:MAG TPA: hypothetical protein PLN21_16410 [Gemmatales bacterium]|nr:hypothetical protein [Gemmatales bacterium]